MSDSTLTETSSQREAITSWRRGHVCVTAGPGSGKTRVLVERFRWLVDEKGVDPRKILAITFTEKAAQQMLERLVSSEKDSAKRQAFQQAPISTIHAFCAGLLREHAFPAGLDPEFAVMEEWEGILERRRIIREVLEDALAEDAAAAERFIRSFAGFDAAVQIEKIYESIRACDGALFPTRLDPDAAYENFVRELSEVSQLFGIRELASQAEKLKRLTGPLGPQHLRQLGETARTLEAAPPDAAAKEAIRTIQKTSLPPCRSALVAACHHESREWIAACIRELDRRYTAWKRSASKLDFSDLEIHAVRLLKDLPNLRSRFAHVLVDEFQDTNGIQSELIQLLEPQRGDGRALFIVGDINQSIYGFRHANPEVFRRYREDLKKHGGHLIELPENFRSRPGILRAAEVILSAEEGIERHDLVAATHFAEKQIPSVEILVVRHGVKGEVTRQEALHVAARITELRQQLRFGKKQRQPLWRDFAVLLRTRELIEQFTACFREAGIPCEVSVGKGFFDAREVRDLTHFLRALSNPRDELSLASVLRSPLVGVSDETLLALKMAGANLAETIRPNPDEGASTPHVEPADAEKLRTFQQRLVRFRTMRDDVPPDLLLNRLLSETGYESHLAAQVGGAHQVANVRKLLELLRRVARSSPLSFDQLVGRIEELRKAETHESQAPVLDETADAVQVMTLHGAKGLEFPVVVLPALHRGSGGGVGDAGYDPETGIGARWKDPSTGEPADDPVFAGIRGNTQQREAEESNRLFYVAMTRAQEHLVLSTSFGSTVRVTHWAKLLRDKLALDFKAIDKTPRERNFQGLRFRLFRTDEPAQITPPEPPKPDESKTVWIDPLAPPEDQADSAAAVTSVALFAQCPRRYYLSRYLGFRQAAPAPAIGEEDEHPGERDEIDATELGLRVHSALAGSYEPATEDTAITELVERFRQSSLGKRVRANANHEEDLLFSIDGRLLRGQLDLWFDDRGERILVDYKTDQVSAEEAPHRARDYELQLQLYALAIEQAAARKPDRAVLYFLQPDLPVDVDVSTPALQTATAKMKEFFDAQSKASFPLHAGRHCFRCQHYRNLCPAKVPKENAARV